MDKSKVKKRLVNLNKIMSIVQIAKFDTIQKIAKTSKNLKHHYEMAKISREVLTFVKDIYGKLWKKNSENSKKLWIFISIGSPLIKTSYEKYFKIFLENFNKEKDWIIPIGPPAQLFADKNKYKIYKQYDSVEGQEEELAYTLLKGMQINDIKEIQLVANIKKVKDKPYQIFPFEDNKKETTIKLKKYTFYSSVKEISENIPVPYFKNIISGIVQENLFHFYAEKLVRHENSIKSIEERIVGLRSDLNKENRKKETEDMINVSQRAKRRKGE